jgi:hypothetical protein
MSAAVTVCRPRGHAEAESSVCCRFQRAIDWLATEIGRAFDGLAVRSSMTMPVMVPVCDSPSLPARRGA